MLSVSALKITSTTVSLRLLPLSALFPLSCQQGLGWGLRERLAGLIRKWVSCASAGLAPWQGNSAGLAKGGGGADVWQGGDLRGLKLEEPCVASVVAIIIVAVVLVVAAVLVTGGYLHAALAVVGYYALCLSCMMTGLVTAGSRLVGGEVLRVVMTWCRAGGGFHTAGVVVVDLHMTRDGGGGHELTSARQLLR
ncbi:hypothetical protein EDB89DRAFT_1905266 [Lactarius sanguifluus]|nr:hypothetical protein EDB89DRAFT_1905266 [Lactarius sanguifluus]